MLDKPVGVGLQIERYCCWLCLYLVFCQSRPLSKFCILINICFLIEGTHWTNEILSMLLTGKAEYTSDSKMGGMMEALPDLHMLERLRSPRILNTHLPYKWFPRSLVNNGGKIIHTLRNPKDAYLSYFYHTSSGLELGRNTKGMSWSQFFDTCVIGKNITMGTWFDYTKEIYEAKRNNKNIHTDPEEEIKELAKFLNVDFSDSFIKEIAFKCEFQNLKKAEIVKEFPPELMEMAAQRMKSDPGFQIPTIYRKGIVGDWKNHFTEEQNKQFDALFKEEMRGTDIDVIFS
ncbi:hypothetical protein FSP39_005858 [Pinctada imbricata]|uniref:Sulfotransferase domain-containing protein n=1 Tax=Pinctada imbricata TaxID=66713 RepID=A0AA89C6H4_PINIB|nr:hypothetical protein FSP39_005858 [Pinctada imbricata]